MGSIDPQLLADLGARWGFTFKAALSSLPSHYVAEVELEEGKLAAILKVGPAASLIKQAKWLSTFPSLAPALLGVDEALGAVLMERLVPGTSLSKKVIAGEDDEATRILADLIRKLTGTKPDADFAPVSGLAHSLDGLAGRVDAQLLSEAKGRYAALCHDRTSDVLLHGDLHHDNVLRGETGWKVIDPHGYVGDPAFEVGPLIYNPHGRVDPRRIQRRFEILEHELPFGRERIRGWAFCMAVLSAAWTLEDDGRVPEDQVELAGVIRDLL